MSRAIVFAILVAVAVVVAFLTVPSILYRGVPHEVALDLAGRGCRVVGSRGIVQGQFTESAERQWAILCQAGERVSLMVYTPGQGRPEVLTTHPASTADPDSEGGEGLRLVSWDYVVQHNPSQRTPAVPRSCLEDGVGMGSTVYCNLGGSWASLMGAD
jgi:hypothetical protein